MLKMPYRCVNFYIITSLYAFNLKKNKIVFKDYLAGNILFFCVNPQRLYAKLIVFYNNEDIVQTNKKLYRSVDFLDLII